MVLHSSADLVFSSNLTLEDILTWVPVTTLPCNLAYVELPTQIGKYVFVMLVYLL